MNRRRSRAIVLNAALTATAVLCVAVIISAVLRIPGWYRYIAVAWVAMSVAYGALCLWMWETRREPRECADTRCDVAPVPHPASPACPRGGYTRPPGPDPRMRYWRERLHAEGYRIVPAPHEAADCPDPYCPQHPPSDGPGALIALPPDERHA